MILLREKPGRKQQILLFQITEFASKQPLKNANKTSKSTKNVKSKTNKTNKVEVNLNDNAQVSQAENVENEI